VRHLERVLVEDLLAASSGAESMTSPTSNDVPPMSVAMTFGCPLAAAMNAVPARPPAGPEPIVVSGRCRATSTGTTPPLACMMNGARCSPCSPSACASCSRYALDAGPT
jgi:hypothetical protein